MGFRTQLVAGHAVSVFLITAISITAIVAFRVTAIDEHTLAHELSGEMDDVQQLRFQAEQLVATSRGYLLTGNVSYLERYETATTRFESTLHDLGDRQLDEVARLHVTRVQNAFTSYGAAAIDATHARASSADANAVIPLFSTLKPMRDELDRSIEALHVYERAERDRLLDRTQTITNRAGTAVLVAATIATVLGLALAWLTISKLSSHYERLRVARASAEAATAARDEVLAMVSHDLRNPLSSITLATEGLAELATPGSHRHLRVIHNALHRMENMIDAQLESARLDRPVPLQRDVCSVISIVDAVEELFRDRVGERGIDFRIEVLDASLVVDRERIIQVLSNLLSNALDHTPPGGRITLAGSRDGARIRFAVADTGPGIPFGHLPYVFDRYWRGRKAGKGLGLGLYICKRLVEAHGGVMGVDSALGHGTTFWFTLTGTDSLDRQVRV